MSHAQAAIRRLNPRAVVDRFLTVARDTGRSARDVVLEIGLPANDVPRIVAADVTLPYGVFLLLKDWADRTMPPPPAPPPQVRKKTLPAKTTTPPVVPEPTPEPEAERKVDPEGLPSTIKRLARSGLLTRNEAAAIEQLLEPAHMLARIARLERRVAGLEDDRVVW